MCLPERGRDARSNVMADICRRKRDPNLSCLELGFECGYTRLVSIDMRRLVYKPAIVLFLLLWNVAAVWSVACRSLCADGVCPLESAAATSCAHSDRCCPGGAKRNAPAHPPSSCVAHLHPVRHFLGSSSPKLDSPSSAVPHSLPASTTSLTALASLVSATCGIHSPPGFTSGRSICQKLTLLRI